MTVRPLLLPAAALLLASCVDPYGNPVNPFGPPPAPPYTDQREQWRAQEREQAQQQNQLAYERGISDGRADANAGLSKNPRRHYQSYTPATEAAYQQGYDQGYLPPLAPLPGGGGWAPPQPQQPPQIGAPGYPSAGGTPRQINDPFYQQGYDYGLRDRVSGRANDPGSHTGRYDPRGRRGFERGYVDGYNSR